MQCGKGCSQIHRFVTPATKADHDARSAHPEIEQRLGLRRGHSVVCLIAVGVPDEAPPPPPRKPLAEITRFIE